ncbi:hypothetical protein E4U42_007213, partial [Claviceps africana]
MQPLIPRQHQPPIRRQMASGAKVDIPAIQVGYTAAQLPEHELGAGVIPDARAVGVTARQPHEQVTAAEDEGR